MSTRSKDYWGKLSQIPFKNESFLRKDELGAELTVLFTQQILRRHKIMLYSRSVAAVLLTVLLSGIVYLSSEITVKTGFYAELHELPGGSDVRLDANSEISYNRIQWFFARQLKLNGSGRFEVTKGSEFKVITQLADVEVLGTVFDVRETNHGELLNVYCEEGSVRVSTPQSATVLKPGESVEVTRDSVLFKPRIEDFYTYSGVPLSEVAGDLERYFNCQIVVDVNIRNVLFSGVIPTADLDQALTILSKSCNVNYRKDNNTVYLYK